MNIQEAIDFEQNLYDLINSCGLPVETAFYVLKSVYLDFQHTIIDYAKKGDTGMHTEQQVFENEEARKLVKNEQSVD